MSRQRVRLHGSPLRFVGRLLTLLLALFLIWYGLMLVLGGVGVSAATLDRLSGYRTAFDFLADLQPEDLSTLARVVGGVVGAIVFVLFAYLAYKALPRPYLARRQLTLSEDDRGVVSIDPRAFERVAESAVAGHPAVTGAAGRWGYDEVTVQVEVRRTSDLADTLRDLQHRVRDALEEHGLPERRVAVTLTGFDPPRQRELA